MSDTGVRRLAAIDIGTVTARLMIADVSSAGIREVARSVDITHLGQGLSAHGCLQERAMERVAACVERYVRDMRLKGVEAHRAVATSASRDAENGDEFLRMLESRGVRPEIIAGQREAELSFMGATADVVGEGVLVNDIGGGSTEIVMGDVGAGSPARIQASASIDVGARRITEMFLHSDPPTADEIAEARAFVAGEMAGYFDSLPSRPQRCISLAGTATTLSAIAMQMSVYESERIHGSHLTLAELRLMLTSLAAIPHAARREVIGLHPDRASVIVGGALVLETLLNLAGLDSTEVSEHDILYGILLDTFGALS